MGHGHRTGVLSTVPLGEGVDGQLSRASPLQRPAILVPLVPQREVVVVGCVVCQHSQGHRVAIADGVLRVYVDLQLGSVCGDWVRGHVHGWRQWVWFVV